LEGNYPYIYIITDQGRIRHERPWYLCVGSETWGEAVFNIQTLSNIIRNNGGVNVTDTLDSTCFVEMVQCESHTLGTFCVIHVNGNSITKLKTHICYLYKLIFLQLYVLN
jgi:hypothetical protein